MYEQLVAAVVVVWWLLVGGAFGVVVGSVSQIICVRGMILGWHACPAGGRNRSEGAD